MLKEINDQLAALVDEAGDELQPVIDKANQVDSVIVTFAMARLAYRLAKKGLAHCVTWLRERRSADIAQISDGSTRNSQSGRID